MSDIKPPDRPVNLEEVQQKLYEKLQPSGWATVLRGFILSNEFKSILEELRRQQQAGERFTPKLKNVFKAFECCPYEKIKLLMLSQDPFPNLSKKWSGESVADGIAFSCSGEDIPQPSLKYIHQEIRKDIYNNDPQWREPMDLKPWAEQGCLLLNIALTTTINKTGTHYLLWRPFIAYLLDVLGWNKPGLVWVFIGAKAKEYMDGIPNNCYKLTAVHPAYSAHMKLPTWDSGGLFPAINEKLKLASKEPMIW